MPLPLPVPPIVKNAKGESIVNPLTKYVKGITLQPTENYSTVTVPAATGNQPGISPTITYQTPVSGYVEILQPLVKLSSSNGFQIYANQSCTRYSGKQWSNRPIPVQFMAGRVNLGLTGSSPSVVCPSFNEIAVAPLLNSQQNISIQYLSQSTGTIAVSLNYKGRLIDHGVNALTKGELVRDYIHRDKVMPFWLTVNESISNASGSLGLPGMTFPTGSTAGAVRNAVFVNKFPNTFIANAFMIDARIADGTSASNKFLVTLRDKSSRALMTAPIPMDDIYSGFSQPYFLNHPIVFNSGDIFTLEVSVKTGTTTFDAYHNVYATFFGMALL